MGLFGLDGPPPNNSGFPGPQSGKPVPGQQQGVNNNPTPAPGSTSGPCLHGSTPNPAGGVTCNPDPGGKGVFGVDFKPWESIDTTVSQAQWQAWEPFRDPKCPLSSPYKSERGEAGCFEKPVDCPDGKMPGGPGTAPCVPNHGGAGATGGGGGGKSRLDIARDHIMAGNASPEDWQVYNAARVAQGKAPLTPAEYAAQAGGNGMPSGISGTGNINDQIAAELQRIMGGQTSFSPEVMGDITAGNKATEQASIVRGSQALRENQAARGVTNSPFAAAQEGRLIQGVGAAFDQGQRELRVTKAKQDFTDKLAGLGKAQEWLNSLRQYALGMDSNNVQRESILSNYELGVMNIKSQMALLQAKIASDKELQAAQLDSTESMNMQQIITCIQTGVC